MSYTVIDHGAENARVFDSRSEAKDKAAGIKQMIDDPAEIEVVDGTYNDYAEYEHDDGGDPGTPAAKAAAPDSPDVQNADEAIDQLGESLEDDPLNVLPGHMKDTIQGQPAVNKRGYAMIAERFGIGVEARVREYPWDNDEGRAVAHATAETEDGNTYSGWATACADDGDMEDQLIELAETRALKRAVSWASGIGIVAYEELADQL